MKVSCHSWHRIFTLFVFLLPFGLSAQVTWDGGAGTTSWSDGANWNPDGVPGDTDDVQINGNYTVNVTSSDSCRSLQLITDDNNNRGVNLILSNGAQLGIGIDLNMDDRDRQNNSCNIDVTGGATLVVGGDLYMTKDNGTSNNNDMLLRISDDNSSVIIGDDLIADFTGNNNSSNDMGISLTESSSLSADDITVDLGSSQESNTLLAINATGVSGDNATVNVTNDFTITNNSGDMDCVIDMDQEGSLTVGGNFTYSATNGEGFYWYIDRDATVNIGTDLTVTKDGNEEVYFYLNQNAVGANAHAQLTVGNDLTITKTDGDDLFFLMSAGSDVSSGGDILINTSNEDDNGDDINLFLSDSATITASDNLRFTFNDDSQVDLLIRASDNTSISVTNEFSVDQTNAHFFELELNDAAAMTVGTDFLFENTSSSNIPVLDLNNTSSLTIGHDFIWTDSHTEDGSTAGIYLDGDAALAVTDTILITKNDDGNLFINLNQSADGSANDAQITTSNFLINKTDGDDLFINLSNDADINATGDIRITTTNEDDNGDDITIILNNTSELTAGEDFDISFSDDSQIDLLIRLNDSSGITTTDSMTIAQDNSHFFELETNDASSVSVGTNFTFTNTTSSNIAVLDMNNTSTMTVGGEFTWTDNNTTDGSNSGIYLDGDASLGVTNDISITKNDDGNLFLYLNQAEDGSANDAQITAANLSITKTDGDDLFFYLSDDADITVTGDITINTLNEDDNGDDLLVRLNNDAGLSIGDDFSVSYNDDSQVDFLLQLNNNGSISITDSFIVSQTNAHFFDVEMFNTSSITVGTDFVFSNTTTSNIPVLDFHDSASFTVSEDFFWTDNGDVDNGGAGFYLDSDATLSITDTLLVTRSTDGHHRFYLNQTTDGAGNDAQLSAGWLIVDHDNTDHLQFRLNNNADITVTNDWIVTADQHANDDFVEITLNGDAGIDVNGNASFTINSTNTNVDLDMNLSSDSALDIAGNLTMNIDADDIDIDMINGCSLIVGGNWTTTITDSDNFDHFMVNSASVNVAGDVTITNTTASDRIIIDMDNTNSFTVGQDLIIDNNSDDGSEGETRITLDADANVTIGDSLFISDSDDDQVLVQMNVNTDGSANDVQMNVGYFVIQKNQGNEVQVVMSNDADLNVTNDFLIEVDDVDQDANTQFTLNDQSGVNVGGNMTFDIDNQPVDLDLDINLLSDDSLNVAGNFVINHTGDNVDIDITNSHQFTVGGTYTATLASSDFYDLALFNTSGLTVTGDYTVSTDATSERILHDLNGTSTVTLNQDMIIQNLSADASDGETNFALDDDASLTVSDSLFITHSQDDQVLIYLNQAADGSAADAQITASYLVIDKDDGDQTIIRLSNDADITISNEVLIDIDNQEADDNLELTLNGSSGIDVDGGVTIDINSPNTVDFDYNHTSSGNFDIGTDFRLTTNGDAIDIDMTGSGDWITGDSLIISASDVGAYDIDMSSSSGITVGSDWVNTYLDGTNFTFDATTDAVIAITNRFMFTNNTGSDLVEIDLDNNASFTCVDLEINNNSGTTVINNGIYMDSDATMTITDSLIWIQPDDGNVFFHLNRSIDGSGADAQLSAATIFMDKDDGDQLAVRLSENADITVTNDFVIDGDNFEDQDHVELQLADESGVDIGGSLLISNLSTFENDVRIYHYSSGDLNIGADLDVDIGGDDCDIDMTGTGDVIVGGDANIDLTTGDNIEIIISNNAAFIIGDDWTNTMTGADDFNLDMLDSGRVQVTDRFTVSNDVSGNLVQIDMDSATSFTAVDFIVRHLGDNTSDNGILMDREASMTISDSLDWRQDTYGSLLFHLNAAGGGPINNAQLSVGTFFVDKDTGNVLRVRVHDEADITVTNNMEITSDNQIADQNVHFDLQNNGGIDVNGSVLIAITSPNNVDFDYDHLSTGNFDIAQDFKLTTTSDDIDIDMTGTGDWIIGDTLSISGTDADNYDIDASSTAAITVGSDWVNSFLNSDDFTLDLTANSSVAVTNRFVFTSDTGSNLFHIDLDDDATFTSVDLEINHFSNTADLDNVIFLDSDASMTITDSLIWTQANAGDIFIFLNQNVDGSAADAQLSVSHLFIDKDDGDDIDLRVGDSGDITVTNNITIISDNQETGDPVAFRLSDAGAIDVDSSVFVTITSPNEVDFRYEHNSTGNFDVDDDFKVISNGDDFDIDMTGTGDWLIGDTLLFSTNDADAIDMDMFSTSAVNVGSDWVISHLDAGNFNLDMTVSSSATIANRFMFTNNAGSAQSQIDLDDDATFTSVDLEFNQNSSTNELANGIYIDSDASMTITDSIIYTQTNEGFGGIYMNQGVNGSAADAQLSASHLFISKDGGDDYNIQLNQDADMTITNNITIQAENMETDDPVLLQLNSASGIDVNGSVLITINSANDVDFDYNHNSSGNFDIANDFKLTITSDDVDIDMAGTGDWITGDSLIVTSSNADNIDIDMSSTSGITVGSDWVTSHLTSDNFTLDMTTNSVVAVTNRFLFTNNSTSDLVEIDLDNNASFTCVDMEINALSNTDELNNGIFIDSDATMTITDSLIWTQANNGNGGIYMNQGVNGSGADAQFAMAHMFIDKDDGDDFNIRLAQDADLTVTNNITIQSDNQEADDPVQIQLANESGIDVNGSVLIDINSSNDVDLDLNHSSSGNFDIANDFKLTTNADDIDVDMTGTGDWIIGDTLLITATNADNYDTDMSSTSGITVGSDWVISFMDSDNFTLDMTSGSSVSVTNRFDFVNNAGSDLVEIDLDNTASFSCVDLDVTHNGATTDIDNGIFIDRDATMTITDSLIWTQTTEGDLFFFLNQNSDGSAADAQLSAAHLFIDKDNGDAVRFRLSRNADITVTNNLTILSDDQEANPVEISLSNDAGIDINNSVVVDITTGDAVTFDLNHSSTGNFDVAEDFYLTTNGQNIDIDMNSTGDWIMGDSLIVNMSDGTTHDIDMSSTSAISVGSDWITSFTNSTAYTLDVTTDASVAVTNRYVFTNDAATTDVFQIDLDNNADFTAVDLEINANAGTDNIGHGIWLDGDATMTITDSLIWNHQNDGNCLLYLNQNLAGSAADAQLVANTITYDKDGGDLLSVRVGNDGDITVAGNFTIDGDNFDASDDAEFNLSGAGGIDINDNLIMSNISSGNNDVSIFHSSSNNFDIANNMDLDLEGDDLEIQLTGTGSLIVGDLVTMDINNSDNINIVANNASTFDIGNDWISNITGSDNFDLDISGSATVAVTDRMTINNDGDGNSVQFDMAGTGSFTSVDLIVNHSGDNNSNNGLFVDGDATITISDSIFWTQSRNGNVQIHLNQDSDGSAADAQISTSYFVIDRDSGDVVRFRLSDGADITVSNDILINSNDQTAGDVTFDLREESGMDVNGNVTVDVNTSSSIDIDVINSSSGNFDIAGDFIATIPLGDDFDVDLTGEGNWNVGGDLNVTLGDADQITFNQLQGSGISVTGDVNLRNTNTNARQILIDMDSVSTFDVGQDLIIYNETTDNNNSESLIRLDRDAALTVSDSLVITHIGNDDLRVELNQESDGSTDDAQLSAGYLILDFSGGGDELEIELSDDADILVSQNMEVDFQDTESTNDDFMIEINDDATITVQGSADFDYNNGFATNVRDWDFDINNNGQLNVGPAAGPYNTQSLTLRMTQGDDFIGRIDDDAQVNVYGDLNIIKTGADDFDLQLNVNSGTGAQLNVFGDVDIDNVENADLIELEFNQSSLFDVEGDIDLQGISSQTQLRIQMDDNSELELAGNFVQNAAPNNFGIFDMNDNSTLELNSTSVQQVLPPDDGGGTDFFDYQNIVFNNTFGTQPQLITGGEITVHSNVDFIDGILVTNLDSIMIIDNDAGVTNANDTSHTNGPVRKVGDDAFTFPVGNGTQYRLCGISAPSATSDIFTATYIDTDPDPLYDRLLKEPSIDHVSQEEYWIIDQDNGSSSVRVTLSWDTNSGGVTELSELLVVHWDDTEWIDEGNIITTGDTVTGTVQSANFISSFSPFTLASTTNTNNPLPIELLEFKVSKKSEEEALIEWTTATEINNDFFEVERSTDAANFEVIGTVDGAGNSTTTLNYELIDENPAEGWNYYRLKQTDFNGTFSYSEIEQVYFDGAPSNIDVWPNPVVNQRFNVEVENFDPENMTLGLRDMTGRPVAVSSLMTENGFRVQIKNNVASGYYLLYINSPDHQEVRKIAVQ